MADSTPYLALAKVPEWLPGAGFKRLAREWCDTPEEMASAPYKFIKDQMVTNMFSRTLSAEEDYTVKWFAVSVHGGGSDTANTPSLRSSNASLMHLAAVLYSHSAALPQMTCNDSNLWNSTLSTINESTTGYILKPSWRLSIMTTGRWYVWDAASQLYTMCCLRRSQSVRDTSIIS
ncbi:uncharacterized protein F5147DRAFT_646924 [Suillus discolor]|uniref:Uncharacterized protein n=1 Tax=Suillus discolor TaxID=1912936 RepID=A0A9P7FLT9_9AGAM|nr:uncharacterized protein F5147DRAFT_646924 [Suillus discolor]KAG2120406.1 hypothetical protein F5147DRAFT_646924 [Suillus discolor]